MPYLAFTLSDNLAVFFGFSLEFFALCLFESGCH